LSDHVRVTYLLIELLFLYLETCKCLKLHLLKPLGGILLQVPLIMLLLSILLIRIKAGCIFILAVPPSCGHASAYLNLSPDGPVRTLLRKDSLLLAFLLR